MPKVQLRSVGNRQVAGSHVSTGFGLINGTWVSSGATTLSSALPGACASDEMPFASFGAISGHGTPLRLWKAGNRIEKMVGRREAAKLRAS